MTNKPTPRAIKLNEKNLEIIHDKTRHFDLPPTVDELIDTTYLPEEYYFITDCPGVTPEKPISWVLMPEFMFEKRFAFATKPTGKQLISIIEKG